MGTPKQSYTPITAEGPPGLMDRARLFALIALAIYALAEVMSVCIFRSSGDLSHNQVIILIAVKSVIIWWIIPFLVVYKVENRDVGSLGLVIGREKRRRYVLYILVGLCLPLLYVGIDKYLIIEFIEQVVYIGLAEEFFNRGYLMTRLCDWLGDRKGLLMTSILFGLGHMISQLAQKGTDALVPASLFGLQAFFGGLLFGFIYLKAKNIWPSAILHVSTNMYIPRIMALFGY